MTLTPERPITRYDPVRHLADDWPEWSIHLTDLHGLDEVIDLRRRIVLIDPGGPSHHDEEWALTHAVAHLSLGHHVGVGPISREQESQADWLARLWLDGGTV